MLVIDNVLYNGDPIIEFRLKYLNEYGDVFLIVESIYTHSGNRKNDLTYNINKYIFKEYEDKILFYRIEYFPSGLSGDDYLNIVKNSILYETKTSWINEVYTRDYIQHH
jgi:beta-1,4-mannosyl-glycoprotein beta-1,4-N-acetylglucosaminyltransferase